MTRRRRRQRRPTAADHRGHYRGDPCPPSPFCQSHLLGFLVAGRDAPALAWVLAGRDQASRRLCSRRAGEVMAVWRLWLCRC